MANKTIVDLTAGTTLDGTELFHGVQGANSRKFTALQMVTPTLSATDQAAARTAISAALKGQLFGLTLSNNATLSNSEIDIAAGEAASQQTRPLLMEYAGTTGVRLDAAYGTGAGGRFDSSISDGTWHVFLISNGTIVGRGLSKSLDPTGQANYPSGYTHYRRIGSILRESAAIVGFVQDGDLFSRKVPAGSGAINNPGTSAVLQPLQVPTGLRIRARFGFLATGSIASSDTQLAVLITDPSTTNTAPSVNAFNFYLFDAGSQQVSTGGQIEVMTDTSGQVRYRIENTSPGGSIYFSVMGWLDTRGRIG